MLTLNSQTVFGGSGLRLRSVFLYSRLDVRDGGVRLRILQLLCVLEELPDDLFVRARGQVGVERLVVGAARDDAVAADAVDGREREVEGPVEREEVCGGVELLGGVAQLLAVLPEVVVPEFDG